MSTYKLIYFNIPGLAEPIRFLLHQSGIKFEDKRIDIEEWPKIKSEMPLGQVPILEIDGKVYYQSKAISRLIAKRNNFYGSNDEEAFLVDATVETIDDLRQPITQHYWEKDHAFKAKLKINVDTKVPLLLNKLEEQVKKNKGYFVNGKLTWADLFYAAIEESLTDMLGYDLNKDHPELKKLSEKIKSLPNIKTYLKNRPKSIVIP
ncbi:glutathione S-transferase S1 [Apis mellifera caucasica]|nr:glutathione S-transferase S1 [Apis mellifera caucasica]